MDVPKLTVILPAYNAGSFIHQSLATLFSYLDPMRLSYELIVVNDGSTDETADRLARLNNERMQVFTLPDNQGKGAAIKRGIELARGNYIVTTDADIGYGPEVIPRFYEALREGAVLAIGDRTLPESRISIPIPLSRWLLGSVYSLLVKCLLYYSGIHDSQCGIKGFHSALAKEFLSYSSVNRFAFDLELIVFAVENRVPVTRLPVELIRSETSSVRMVTDSLCMFKDAFQIAWSKWRGYYRSSACFSQNGVQ